jgi:predicted DNA-binding transcriptional regulator AlpA
MGKAARLKAEKRKYDELNPPHPLETTAAGGRPHEEEHPQAASRERELVEPLREEAIADLPRLGEPWLMDMSEIAHMLKLSLRTVQRLERDEGIPGRVVIKGNVRYYRKSVLSWLLSKIEGQSHGE